MTTSGAFQLALYFAVLLALVKPLGWFMARVYTERPCGLDSVLGPFERLFYRLAGVKAAQEMNWKQYAAAVLIFSAVGLFVVYGLQRFQASLAFNPQGLSAITADSSFNTSISFVTNTNWQGYGGETTMSYLSQMLALGTQNFVSAATGMAVLVALIRGLSRRSAATIGNFWVDLTRSILYILLPLSAVFALVLVSQGVVQTFKPYQAVTLTQPLQYDDPVPEASGNTTTSADGKPVSKAVAVIEQVLPLGPAASQIAIKQLGTNGGGFFSVNSAHPYENPTPLTNFLELLAILLIPAALCWTFGEMVGDRRQGWAVLAAMLAIFVVLLGACVWAESGTNPRLSALGVDSAFGSAGNMEGKEVRFGIANSALWATATTAASNGSVNAMHDSFTPLGGLIPMWLMQLGEVIFGGVGCGLYGMLMFVIVAVFVAGLMVGRTPEYLGKKIEPFEMKMAALAVLMPCALVLLGTAIAVLAPQGQTTSNPGAHGFSQILYAFSSASNNNGSAFAGLSANNPFYNTSLGICMFLSRFWLIVPVLAVAGSLAGKRVLPTTSGTLPTHTPVFVGMLICVVIIVGALTFVPALALGPIVEQLQLQGH
ncbi:MAG: potassium-transporting ATPase subunit KdpA [Phycisphaeraceae bacterium]|nr:potassium-transporting ATPase subunit KdpA [Phycisphaeraceae bacterium]